MATLIDYILIPVDFWTIVHAHAFGIDIISSNSEYQNVIKVAIQLHWFPWSPRCVKLVLQALNKALWQQSSTGEWRLLQCASRHITDTEARYSATEIELLAVVWAAKKAHLFIAGADVELIADHRPLISIINSKTLETFNASHCTLERKMVDPIPPERHVETWHWA